MINEATSVRWKITCGYFFSIFQSAKIIIYLPFEKTIPVIAILYSAFLVEHTTFHYS